MALLNAFDGMGLSLNHSFAFFISVTFGYDGFGLDSLSYVVNYRDDERRGLDVGVTPATLVREVVAGTPSIMGG